MELVLMAGVLFHQLHELLTGIDAQGHVLVSRVFDGSVPLWVGWAADLVAYIIVLLICVPSLVLLAFLLKSGTQSLRPILARHVLGPLRRLARRKLRALRPPKAGSRA